MFNLGIAFLTALLAVLVISAVSLSKSEINQKRRQASSSFDGREAIAGRKLQKIRRAYIKDRLKQREHLNREVSSLGQLLQDSSIDENTYARYKKLLEISYEQKRQQTRERCGFTKTPLT